MQDTQLSVDVVDLPSEIVAVIFEKVEQLLCGEELSALRIKGCVDLREAADFLGVTMTQVWLLEDGRSSLGPEVRERLRRYYISKILERLAIRLRG